MNILIIGCGWVGTIFAKKLIKLNHHVHCTTTSPEKISRMKSDGMIAHHIDFSQDLTSHDSILSSTNFDLILVSVPAKKAENHDTCLVKFKNLGVFLQTLKSANTIYLSSVGIYPTIGQTICESNIPVDQLNAKLYQVEQILSSKLNKLNILRLGGIFGYDRIPGKHFSGKVCKVGNQMANYIHVDDICNILLTILQARLEGETFNAVSPDHPKKNAVIKAMVAKYGFLPPLAFDNAEEQSKIVSSEKLIKQLHYKFLYPSPLTY